MRDLPSDIIHEIIDNLVDSHSVLAYDRIIVQTLLSLCLVNSVCKARASFYLYLCMDLRDAEALGHLDMRGTPTGVTVRSMSFHKGCFQTRRKYPIFPPRAAYQAERLILKFSLTVERIYLDSVALPYSTDLEATFAHLPNLRDIAIAVDFFPIFSSHVPDMTCPSVQRLAIYDRSRHPRAYANAILPRFPNLEVLVLAWRDIDRNTVENILTSHTSLRRLIVILPPLSHTVLYHDSDEEYAGPTTTITVREKNLIAARHPHVMFIEQRAPDEPPTTMPSWAKKVMRTGEAWTLSGTTWR